MTESVWLQEYLLVGGLLFAIGLVGLAVRRNLLVMLICVEIMLQGVSLSLVAWARYHGDPGGGIWVLMIITVAACEAAVALTLALLLARWAGSLDVAAWQRLRERERPAHVDRHIPPREDEPSSWPRLAPAGLSGDRSPEEIHYRPHV